MDKTSEWLKNLHRIAVERGEQAAEITIALGRSNEAQLRYKKENERLRGLMYCDGKCPRSPHDKGDICHFCGKKIEADPNPELIEDCREALKRAHPDLRKFGITNPEPEEETMRKPPCDGGGPHSEDPTRKRYPIGTLGDAATLCWDCWVAMNKHRYHMGRQHDQDPKDWPQQNWHTAEVVQP